MKSPADVNTTTPTEVSFEKGQGGSENQSNKQNGLFVVSLVLVSSVKILYPDKDFYLRSHSCLIRSVDYIKIYKVFIGGNQSTVRSGLDVYTNYNEDLIETSDVDSPFYTIVRSRSLSG